MKILHTADWHIGKKLHKHELSQDFELFIKWLCSTIKEYKVEVLLVSGDIFDLANPSSDARKQYYKALMQLRKLNCKIILTGGNHDSPSMLDAPKEILRELDIDIIGGLPDNLEDVIIPVILNGKIKMVIVALPFLRDCDLRNATDGHTYEDRLETIRRGIESTFINAAEICKTKYPGIPAIAMGHLFAAGAESSESEREIQIGNQAAFNAWQFGNYFNYIALGHIHKPQRINAAVPAFYSGSPFPLSFSERKDEKRILLIDIEQSWEPQSIPVPSFRSLLKITGTIEELRKKLQNLTEHKEFDSLLEVELQEENYDALKIFDLDELVTNFNKTGFVIVKHRATFTNKLKGAGEIYKNEQLEDLKPKDIFWQLINQHQYDEELQKDILTAFDELLEEVQNSENIQL